MMPLHNTFIGVHNRMTARKTLLKIDEHENRLPQLSTHRMTWILLDFQERWVTDRLELRHDHHCFHSE